MKQVVQSPRSGLLELMEVPAPACGDGQVLVRNHFSVVSPGTERMAISFARKSLLGKARSRPDLVRQVARKLRQEGPLPTYRAVMTRLDALQPLGYSCAGVVEAIGADVCDVNMGCPANKVLKGCAGCALMGDLDLARRIIAEIRRAITIPLTRICNEPRPKTSRRIDQSLDGFISKPIKNSSRTTPNSVKCRTSSTCSVT